MENMNKEEIYDSKKEIRTPDESLDALLHSIKKLMVP